jgi:endonuclease YncB( thermonuclease family)
LVRLGWACAYTKYSKDYLHLEHAARIAKSGIWFMSNGTMLCDKERAGH